MHSPGTTPACAFAARHPAQVAKFKPQELPDPEGSYGDVFGIREKLNPGRRRVDDPFGRE